MLTLQGLAAGTWTSPGLSRPSGGTVLLNLMDAQLGSHSVSLHPSPSRPLRGTELFLGEGWDPSWVLTCAAVQADGGEGARSSGKGGWTREAGTVLGHEPRSCGHETREASAHNRNRPAHAWAWPWRRGVRHQGTAWRSQVQLTVQGRCAGASAMRAGGWRVGR